MEGGREREEGHTGSGALETGRAPPFHSLIIPLTIDYCN